MSERIDKYLPKMDPAHWAAIEDFVREAVRDTLPTSPYAASFLLNVVATHTHWAWMCGEQLDRTTIFDRLLIERFIASGCPATWSSGTRGNARSVLFRVAEATLGQDARTPRLTPLEPAKPLQPYSASEVVAFRSWANSRPGTEQGRSCMVLLAFGLGAGLATEDIGQVLCKHITTQDGAVIIHVPGRRARQVVVGADWEAELLAAIADLAPDDYAFRRNRTRHSRNVVTGLVRETTGRTKPQGQRLRATWVVHHLTIGTPVKVLMEAAGVKSLEAFTRYVPFVPGADPKETIAKLRGELRS